MPNFKPSIGSRSVAPYIFSANSNQKPIYIRVFEASNRYHIEVKKTETDGTLKDLSNDRDAFSEFMVAF